MAAWRANEAAVEARGSAAAVGSGVRDSSQACFLTPPVERVRAAVQRWQQFQDEGRRRVQEAQEFLAPVSCDPEGNGARDAWVLVRVAAVGGGGTLNSADALRCFVADRFGRANLANRLGERVVAVLPLHGFQRSHADAGVASELAVCPGCAQRHDRRRALRQTVPR